MEEENNLKTIPNPNTETVVEEGRLLEDTFKRNVIYTLFYLFEGLIVTELTTLSIHKIPALLHIIEAHLLLTTLVAMVSIIVNTAVLRQAYERQHGLTKWVCWILHSVIVGIPQIVLNIETFPLAIFYTSILVLILVLKSFLISESIIDFFMPKLDILQLIILLMSGYYIAFSDLTDTLSLIVNMVTQNGGFLIFSGLLVCDASCLRKVARKQRFDPMIFSLLLHTDITNLFFRSAVLISSDSK